VSPGGKAKRHDPVAPTNPDRVVPPAPSPIDLHTHSTRSDGLAPPADLVQSAFEAGVRLLALTDHDNLAGYREVTAARAIPMGMTLLPGVEINAIVPRDLGLWEGELHILGFGMDPDDEAFEATLARQRARRRERFERMVARLRELGLPIDDQLADRPVAAGESTSGADASVDALGRPTVARAMIDAGYVESVDEAFSRYLSFGKPGYVPRSGLDPTGAIRAIRVAGGLPVLAHFSEAPSRIPVLRELIDVGLGGLEVYYRSFDAPTVFAVGEVATALDLVPTGGSDYHGDFGPYAESHAMLWVPPEVGPPLEAAIGVSSARARP
jgi:predicted metal-dependent phosphoesterase TrpH